jgi:hypothetical protein
MEVERRQRCQAEKISGPRTFCALRPAPRARARIDQDRVEAGTFRVEGPD